MAKKKEEEEPLFGDPEMERLWQRVQRAAEKVRKKEEREGLSP